MTNLDSNAALFEFYFLAELFGSTSLIIPNSVSTSCPTLIEGIKFLLMTTCSPKAYGYGRDKNNKKKKAQVYPLRPTTSSLRCVWHL